MGKQSKAFLAGEGTAWRIRNLVHFMHPSDPVLSSLQLSGVYPSRILDIGCCNGQRLRRCENLWKCATHGIDPGIEENNQFPGCVRGTADDLRIYQDRFFDTVVYGWCLYLCDPEDYFKIAAEGDRVLQEGGHIVIHDFNPEESNFKIKYKHLDGLYSYHTDFSKLWAGNPAYRTIAKDIHPPFGPGGETSVIILRKSLSRAFEERK